MKAKEIRNINSADLENKLRDLKEELFKLKFQLSLNQLSNTSKIKEVKRYIARINTVLTEREMANKEG